MTIEETLKNIAKLSKSTEEVINGLISEFDAKIIGIQKDLLLSLLSDFTTTLNYKDGILERSVSNFNKIATFEKWFLDFRKLFLENQIIEFGNKLLDYSKETGNYYKAIGFPIDTIDNILQKNSLLEARLGIKDNKLVKGGYLDNLATVDSVKNDLKNIVLTNINNKATLQSLTKSLSSYIKGSNGINGSLQRYYDQYAYDSFNSVREIKNQEFAEKLNLRFFLYSGTTISTTRKFCSMRADKVFHVSETKDWVNDPNLIDQKTKALYNPLIDRGRYRCRHHILYVPDKIAQRLDLEKFNKFK